MVVMEMLKLKHIIPFLMMMAFLVMFFTPVYSVVVWLPQRAGKTLWYGLPWFIGIVLVFIIANVALTLKYREHYK
ncbi:hypothetical protein [Alicyclobacillus sp. SO9]|uniref:hypothetical protein n=1 Tax=Alicyclobacillus sp. SO9 TaxID=2665646 RepID=UPI0018E8E0F8|nr:hypothetical protein [Alicyclobacillus sp. SO9]QQE78025.1 hypothetical protein GI364_19295 [Alicyclobacillus sp. SO9]